jgi:transposase-like protein
MKSLMVRERWMSRIFASQPFGWRYAQGQSRAWRWQKNSCIWLTEAWRQGLLKIIPDASTSTLIPIIERKVIPDSIVYSDCWRGYNALDVSEFKHFRINHSKLFADKRNHINGIKNFWNQAKRHMRKFNGVPKEHFGLFLKECEFRFNYGTRPEGLRSENNNSPSSKNGTFNKLIYYSPKNYADKPLKNMVHPERFERPTF